MAIPLAEMTWDDCGVDVYAAAWMGIPYWITADTTGAYLGIDRSKPL
jgi:hypothetical protein